MIAHHLKLLRRVTTIALVLAIFVVMLGAYTRLTNAGLGCPDWPGCYGRMVLPQAPAELLVAQQQFPNNMLEASKAWTEMGHRYAAGTLALLIGFIGLTTVLSRRKMPGLPILIPNLLIGLVVFQALLGMWTVTLKLLPVVVMSHLLGGILIFVSLGLYRWQLSVCRRESLGRFGFWIGLGVFIVFLQIALGGWVSSNYAGVACVGFPQCNGVWWPKMDFSHGFYLFSAVGENYQGGLLDSQARMAIQWIHRLFAVFTALYVLILAMVILAKAKTTLLRGMAMMAVSLLLLQLLLGIVNVVYLLPLPIAVMHNGVAALLLFSMVSLCYLGTGVKQDGTE